MARKRVWPKYVGAVAAVLIVVAGVFLTVQLIRPEQECPRTVQFGYYNGDFMQLGAKNDPNLQLDATKPVVMVDQPGYLYSEITFTYPTTAFAWWTRQGDEEARWTLRGRDGGSVIVPTTGKMWVLVLYDDPASCRGGGSFDPAVMNRIKADGQWPE
jgi:hypothetical protein